MKSTNKVLELSDTELSALTTQLDRMTTELGEGVDTLDPKQAIAMVKLSGRRTKAAATITSLATKFGITLPSSNVASIATDLAAAAKLRAILASVEGLHKVLTDHVLVSEGNAWMGASTLYGALKAEARRNPALKEALKPISDQLTVPRKKGAKADTQSAEATTAGTTTATQSATTAASKSPT